MDPIKKLDIPIDVDNEALILANSIKNDKHRELFTKTIDYLDFQYKENQVLAWTIQELERNNLACNIDTILVKSLSCPVKFKIDFEYVSEVSANFNEVPENNLRVHFNKLKTDKVKQELSEFYYKSIYTACLDPRVDMHYLETRINYAKDIVTRNGSVGITQFLNLETMVDNFIEGKGKPSEFKSTGFPALDELLTDGYKSKGITVIAGLPGMGKCLIAHTPILMYDGTYKMVQHVRDGDLVMGVDALPRKVLSTHIVEGTRYEVTQSNGDDYVVNESHLLHLVATSKYEGFEQGELINISAKDFYLKDNMWKKSFKGYKAKLDFSERELPLDPYLLGLWLSDTINSCVEPPNTLNRLASLKFNQILETLGSFCLCKTQEIPVDYKINSTQNRLQLLAGIIDSSTALAHLSDSTNKVKDNFILIQTQYRNFAKDIAFVARSLGFYSMYKEDLTGMWEVIIEGDLSQIPTMIASRKKTKQNKVLSDITVTSGEEDTFYGFELDGDHLFMIEDLTVCHNSSYTLSSMYNLSNVGTWCPQFALEMDNMSITTKLAAFSSGISVKRIAKEWNNFSANEKKLIEYELERLKRNPYILCNDTPGQSLKTIREQVMVLQDRLQSEYMFVSIDLFGKIKEFQTSDNFARNYEQELNKTQVMAKELGVNLGLVAQINRAVMSRKFNRPKMSDLKNAGAWEEVADLMIGIHRPFYDPEKSLKGHINFDEDGTGEEDIFRSHNGNPSDLEANIAEAIIMKQRNGEGNTIANFIFDPETTRYIPVAQEDQAYVNLSKNSLSEV